MQYHLPKNIKGYSIIELLIVVVIMGFLAALVIPSFSNFQQDQDLKLTAEEMASNIRLAQSRSLSGSKGTTCASTDTLLGWYFSVQKGAAQNTYSIAGACKSIGNVITDFNTETKTAKNSKIVINNVAIDGVGQDSKIFGIFAPVNGKVTYYQTSLSTVPINSTQQVEITIINNGVSAPNTQKVVITKSGDVYVK